jgi:hypothetical protein
VQIESAWQIECRTMPDVRYLRARVAELMRSLDGVVLVDPGVAGSRMRHA